MPLHRRLLMVLLLFVTINAYSLRDPTRPPGAAKVVQKDGKTEPLVLNGIVHSNQRSFAIINGKKLAVGDMIAGSKLLKIEKTAVYLKDGDEITKLLLVPHQSEK